MKRLIAISVLLLTVAANAQNLNFKIAPVQDSASTAAWTSATTLNTVLKVTVTNRSSVSVYYSPSGGSVTGGVIAFQRSQDDSIYSPVFCTGADGTNNGTQFTLGASAQEWICAVGNATKFQVKLSTQVAGAGTANVSVTASSSAPGPAATIVAASVLPSGAATETTLAAMNAKIPASPATDRSTAAAPFATRLTDGTSFYKGTTPADTQPISAVALPLPPNAAQETGGNLAAIKTDVDKIPAQGQALAAASMPVVLPAAQITTLTPPAAITNFANETGGNLAAAKTDLDTLAGIVSAAKAATKLADGDNVTLGTKADAKSAATDTTAITAMQVLKEISFLLQNALVVNGSGVTQPVSIATAPQLVASSAIIGKVGIDQTTPGTTNGVQLNAAIPAGANLMGKVGIDQTTPGTTNGTQDAATSATGAAPPAKASFNGNLGSGATGGLLAGVTVGDTYKNINVSTATTTLLVTGVAGRQVRITALHMVTAAANNVALIEGTGATCGTGTAGMAGGTTAATGYNFSANGGMTEGAGLGTVVQTATAGDSVCIVTSAATQLSGGLQYAIY
jgi:hypothetical protein